MPRMFEMDVNNPGVARIPRACRAGMLWAPDVARIVHARTHRR